MLGNKRVMGKNILFYMDKKGIERKDLAVALGVPYSSLTTWINGDAYPRIDKIELMANYFGCSKSDLVEERGAVKGTKAIRIPVYGKVAAGIPLEMIEDITDYEEIPEEMLRGGKEYFALTIRGDSMSPRMQDGDVVIVLKQPEVESGEIAVVTINSADATCKRVRITPEGILLMPINPNFEPFFYTHREIERLPIKILGKVIELRAKF